MQVNGFVDTGNFSTLGRFKICCFFLLMAQVVTVAHSHFLLPLFFFCDQLFVSLFHCQFKSNLDDINFNCSQRAGASRCHKNLPRDSCWVFLYLGP